MDTGVLTVIDLMVELYTGVVENVGNESFELVDTGVVTE